MVRCAMSVATQSGSAHELSRNRRLKPTTALSVNSTSRASVTRSRCASVERSGAGAHRVSTLARPNSRLHASANDSPGGTRITVVDRTAPRVPTGIALFEPKDTITRRRYVPAVRA